MDSSYEYRSYLVRREGAAFSAVSTDGERFKMRSTDMLRLTKAIDVLWDAVEGFAPAPAWLFGSNAVDLDKAMGAAAVAKSSILIFPAGPKAGMPARAAA